MLYIFVLLDIFKKIQHNENRTIIEEWSPYTKGCRNPQIKRTITKTK